jgi:branched-chain amino acid transport system permease protein
MTRTLPFAGLAVLAAIPFLGVSAYYLHLLIQVLIWGLVYTAWSIMGRFRLVSLGHGAFLGIGCYTVVMLWNTFALSPWLGLPIGVGAAVLLALAIGYPCFRFRIVGHYFALVTLALGEVVRLVIVALRDHTGGSLGLTPLRAGDGTSLAAFQFADKEVFYGIVLGAWLFGLWVWGKVDQSVVRHALDAISDDEEAAASVGINVTREKLRITMLSAALTAFAGILYGQYQMYLNPGTVAGVAVSLQIVFAAIAGGAFVRLGPTVGAVITIALAELLRIIIGNELPGADTTIYGLMLILFIIFMPKGVLGAALARWHRRTAAAPEPQTQPR